VLRYAVTLQVCTHPKRISNPCVVICGMLFMRVWMSGECDVRDQR
jgi:hypothetical protein